MSWRRGSVRFACLLAVACANQPSDRTVVAPNGASSGHAAPPTSLGRVVVFAGEFARNHTMVTFPLSGDVSRALFLRDSSGKKFPLQRHSDGAATFVLHSLAAGQKAVFAIEQADAGTSSGAGAMEREKGLELSAAGRTVVRFQLKGEVPQGIDAVYERGGYL